MGIKQTLLLPLPTDLLPPTHTHSVADTTCNIMRAACRNMPVMINTLVPLG
jgi:hypothetical protein